jgi:hypothetical protein
MKCSVPWGCVAVLPIAMLINLDIGGMVMFKIFREPDQAFRLIPAQNPREEILVTVISIDSVSREARIRVQNTFSDGTNPTQDQIYDCKVNTPEQIAPGITLKVSRVTDQADIWLDMAKDVLYVKEEQYQAILGVATLHVGMQGPPGQDDVCCSNTT